jgi:hypothetical protein
MLDYEDVEFYNVTVDAPMGSGSYTAPPAGSDTGEPLPTQCQALVLWYTATKRSVGKKFIPGFTIDSVVNGQTVQATPLAALNSFGTDLLTPVTTANGTYTFGNYVYAATYFIPWTTRVARTAIYTQRRRRPGVGE